MSFRIMSRKRSFGIALGCACMLLPNTAGAGESTQPAWEHELTLYGWFTDLDGTASGSDGAADFSFDVSDIVDNLNFAMMATLESHYGKWSIVADVLYMDVEDDDNSSVTIGPIGRRTVDGDVDFEMSSWVVQGGVGYNLIDTESGRLAVLGGLRYLYVDVDTEVHIQGTLADIHIDVSDSEGIIDGIVGFRGGYNFNENWYLPYYADIGTGDSDVTYQLFAGIGYRFSWGHIRAGYRYLAWEFDDDDMIMEDMDIHGPIAGVTFNF